MANTGTTRGRNQDRARVAASGWTTSSSARRYLTASRASASMSKFVDGRSQAIMRRPGSSSVDRRAQSIDAARRVAAGERYWLG